MGEGVRKLWEKGSLAWGRGGEGGRWEEGRSWREIRIEMPTCYSGEEGGRI